VLRRKIGTRSEKNRAAGVSIGELMIGVYDMKLYVHPVIMCSYHPLKSRQDYANPFFAARKSSLTLYNAIMVRPMHEDVFSDQEQHRC